MNHLLDITGFFLYLIYKVLVFPLLLVLGTCFTLITLVKGFWSLVRMVRSIKLRPLAPLYRLARFGVPPQQA
jgi:hypothetical protein